MSAGAKKSLPAQIWVSGKAEVEPDRKNRSDLGWLLTTQSCSTSCSLRWALCCYSSAATAHAAFPLCCDRRHRCRRGVGEDETSSQNVTSLISSAGAVDMQGTVIPALHWEVTHRNFLMPVSWLISGQSRWSVQSKHNSMRFSCQFYSVTSGWRFDSLKFTLKVYTYLHWETHSKRNQGVQLSSSKAPWLLKQKASRFSWTACTFSSQKSKGKIRGPNTQINLTWLAWE